MKSRILFCDYWEDPKVLEFSVEERIIGVYFWTNSRASLCGLYQVSEPHILLETGTSKESLISVKAKLESLSRVHFFENWVYLPHAQKLCGYINDNQKKGVEKEVSRVPPEILNHFRSLGYAIPYGYPINSPRNRETENITYKEEKEEQESDEMRWTSKDTEDFIHDSEISK